MKKKVIVELIRESINPIMPPAEIDWSMCTFIESHPMASGRCRKPGRQYPITKPSITSVSYRNRTENSSKFKMNSAP